MRGVIVVVPRRRPSASSFSPFSTYLPIVYPLCASSSSSSCFSHFLSRFMQRHGRFGARITKSLAVTSTSLKSNTIPGKHRSLPRYRLLATCTALDERRVCQAAKRSSPRSKLTSLLPSHTLGLLGFSSEYFGKLSNLRKPRGSLALSSSVQLCLAQLAVDLSSGGFNEIILASVSVPLAYHPQSNDA